MRRRSGRIAAARRLGDVLAGEDGSSPRSARGCAPPARASVDLPQPDSPTRPTVSPRATSRSTPSTARTTLARPKKPSRGSGKCFTRPRTDSSGSPRRLRAPARACAARPWLAGRARRRRRQRLARIASPSSAPCGRAPARAAPGARRICSMRNGQRAAKRQPTAGERIGRRALDGGQAARCRADAGRCAARR